MKIVKRALVFAACLAMLATVLAPLLEAQDLHPSRRPSPMGMARTTIDDTYVFVVYSRPYERGRDNIFGSADTDPLVPYGEIWRTGANEASQLTTTGDLEVAGKPLEEGTYSFFTTPGADEWKIHFNSALGLSGTARFDPETREFGPGYLPENDVLVVSAKPTTLPEDEKVEQLTISFEPTGEGSADMILRWIRTEVRVPIGAAE